MRGKDFVTVPYTFHMNDIVSLPFEGFARSRAVQLMIGSEQANEVLLEERLGFQRRRCSQGTESQIYFARLHILK